MPNAYTPKHKTLSKRLNREKLDPMLGLKIIYLVQSSFIDL